ncbi:MAG: GNAT family N-acetyltransferase [Chitinophagaceae bacterium]|nr:GNAT family N-acetyltransferase [Chitinophagaceae bacterium]
MELTWIIKKFEALSVSELYAIMRLRNEVFVVEQDCVYQDADNKDQLSWHLCGWYNDKLAAYTRIIPPGASYTEASIGRVVSSPEYRKQGIGRLLMIESIKHCSSLFPNAEIRIGAQLYLKNFYQSLGFSQCSDEYLEDGIPHIEMILNE